MAESEVFPYLHCCADGQYRIEPRAKDDADGAAHQPTSWAEYAKTTLERLKTTDMATSMPLLRWRWYSFTNSVSDNKGTIAVGIGAAAAGGYLVNMIARDAAREGIARQHRPRWGAATFSPATMRRPYWALGIGLVLAGSYELGRRRARAELERANATWAS